MLRLFLASGSWGRPPARCDQTWCGTVVQMSHARQAVAVLQDGAVLIAPDFLIAEVCNAAWRRRGSAASAELRWRNIAANLSRFLDALVSSTGLAPPAVAMAGQLDRPVYDCLYLALAEAEQTKLVQLICSCRRTVRGKSCGDEEKEIAPQFCLGRA
jgi:predicted nucleic acid-binding protein